MGLPHRKLIPDICQEICHVEEQPCSSPDCKVCLKFCLTNPFSYFSSPPPPPPPLVLDEDEHQGHHHKISIYLILTLSLLLAAFFAVCCYAIYTRFFSRRRRRRRREVSSQQQTQETRDDFVDEEHGPVVDHPIWYIRTLGLHQSIISAITVCKYKKGEGLIEGTECSVCLSEFQEDENLRLLPKCRHAFHLPCIDTWLTSHTNCPICRAPILTNPAITRIPSLDPNLVDSTSLRNTQMELVETSAPQPRNRVGEHVRLEVEDGTRVCETESPVDDVAVNIRPRRSFSLDSSSVENINLALATVLSVESDETSNIVLGDGNEAIVPKTVTRNKNLPSTSKGSSSFRTTCLHLQSVPSSMKRSRSYNGKNFLSCYSRSQRKPNANASLRSF